MIVCYTAFQLIPLPLPLVDMLSPSRASLVHAANAVLPAPASFAPLSLVPGAGLRHFIAIATSVVLVFLIRELAWEIGPWKVVAPVIAIALAEAIFGMVQAYFLGAGEARGTWANRNHFADFLAMCLPFAVAYAISAWQRFTRGRAGARSALLIWLGFCVAVVLLVAIIQSLSRMGFTAAILAVAVVAALLTAISFSEWHPANQRVIAVSSAFLSVLLAAFLLAPPELISRFSKVEFSDGVRTQDRLLLWDESFPLISAYPAFGTGLGGYESGFLKYKATFPLVRDAFAHNDYLQYLIELGAVGFSIFVISAAAIAWQTVRALIRSRGEERALVAACCGAFAAILLHSTVDFNLYIPANRLLLAWLVGLACSSGLRDLRSEVIMPVRAYGHGLQSATLITKRNYLKT
jgi:O-antigen ligase